MCASPIHRLYTVDVEQNKRTVSAVVDTRKVTTVSANWPTVEASTDSCYTGTSSTQGNGCLAAEPKADVETQLQRCIS
jgi:hypothetical protein